MYLGRIITTSKKIDPIDYIEITNDLTLDIDNINIPTLIIGKTNAEKLVGKENIKYLDKKVKNNLYWTFGKTERRNEYEKDLKSFKDMVIKNTMKKVNYYHFNIFTEPNEKIMNLISFIKSDKEKYIYMSKDNIYIYYNGNVIGISFNELRYVFSNKTIENKKKQLFANKANKIITDEYFLSKKIKKQVNGNKIIIPYMFFLNKE